MKGRGSARRHAFTDTHGGTRDISRSNTHSRTNRPAGGWTRMVDIGGGDAVRITGTTHQKEDRQDAPWNRGGQIILHGNMQHKTLTEAESSATRATGNGILVKAFLRRGAVEWTVEKQQARP